MNDYDDMKITNFRYAHHWKHSLVKVAGEERMKLTNKKGNYLYNAPEVLNCIH